MEAIDDLMIFFGEKFADKVFFCFVIQGLHDVQILVCEGFNWDFSYLSLLNKY